KTRRARDTKMRNISVLVLGFCLSLLPIGPAIAAAPLTTPSLFGDAIVCSVTNVGTTPVSMFVEVVRDTGQQDSSCGATLNPGEALANCGGSVTPGLGYYCRFTGGTKKRLRASIA